MREKIRNCAMALVASLVCLGALGAAPAKNKPPVVTLTSPTSGATYSQPASITFSATASDPDGTVAKVDFLRGNTLLATVSAAPYTYTWTGAAAGSYSITAKATDNKGATASSAAANITVTAPQPVTSITSPANNATITFGNAVNVSGSFVGTPETTILVHSVQQGSTVVAKQTSATTYLAQSVPLATGVNTLIAKAVRRDGTSSSGSVTVNVPNMMAVVTSPLRASVHDLGTPVTLRASVGTAAGSIQRVEYYRMAVAGILGSSTTPPYAVTVTPAVGDYAVYARVFDALGNAVDSEAIPFSVLGPNQLPSVSVTSPGAGQSFTAPASFTLSATASDPDGSVSYVEFLQNGQPLGSYSSAPYSHAITSLTAGTYAFTARATDNRSGVTTSSPVSVSVNPPGNSPPVVTLTAPAEAVPGARVKLRATASDSDGSIQRVEFHANDSLLGAVTAAPYELSWPATATGTYVVTATAYDDSGAATLSAPTTLKVWDGITYLHHDIAGNVIAASDSAGNQVWKESFRPYGEKLKNEPASQGNRQAFHAKESDPETGLSYFGARYYDPVLGRFMGVDPVLFTEMNLHSFNRYAYGNNNPNRFKDPDGRQAVDQILPQGAPIVALGRTLGAAAAYAQGALTRNDHLQSEGSRALTENRTGAIEAAGVIGSLGRARTTKAGPGPSTDKAGNEIGRIIVDGRGNAMIEPVGGRTVAAGKNGADTHTLYPNGSNYQRLNPSGHANNPTPHGHGHAPGTGPGMRGQGPSLDPGGNVVAPNSPAAHWPIH